MTVVFACPGVDMLTSQHQLRALRVHPCLGLLLPLSSFVLRSIVVSQKCWCYHIEFRDRDGLRGKLLIALLKFVDRGYSIRECSMRVVCIQHIG